MKEYKIRVKNYIDELNSYMLKYDIENDKLFEIKDSLEEFSFKVPLVGEFNSGKSSLINKFLKRDLLRTYSHAETALPYEISYGEIDNYQIIASSGIKELTESEINNGIYATEKGNIIKLDINDDLLKEIDSTTIVDMPGLNSGYKSHNLIIDDYMIKSISYILVVPADEGITKNCLDFIRELKIYDSPLHVIITKKDLRPDSIDDITDKVSRTIIKYLGKPPESIVAVSSFNNDINGFKDTLRKLEEISSDKSIIYFNNLIEPIHSNIISKLSFLIESWGKDLSELRQQQNDIKRSMKILEKEFEIKSKELKTLFKNSVHTVKSSISDAINNDRERLSTNVANGIDISQSISIIVRKVAVNEIQNNFVIESSNLLNNILDDFSTTCSELSLPINLIDTSKTKDALKKVGAELIGIGIGSAIGTAIAPGIGTIIGAVIGSLLDNLLDFIFKGAKEAKLKQKASERLNSIIPQLVDQVEASLLMEENRIVESVLNPLRERVGTQLESSLKTLSDLEIRIDEEKTIEEAEKEIIKDDLATLEHLSIVVPEKVLCN